MTLKSVTIIEQAMLVEYFIANGMPACATESAIKLVRLIRKS